MKRFFSKFRKSFAYVAALMLAAMLWSASANAQAYPKPGINDWMPASEAVNSLNQEVGLMDQQLQVSYDQPLDYKRKFYNCIVISLEQGEPVLDAVNGSYERFVPVGGSSLSAPTAPEIPNPLPLQTWQSYYQEVVLLLQN